MRCNNFTVRLPKGTLRAELHVSEHGDGATASIETVC